MSMINNMTNAMTKLGEHLLTLLVFACPLSVFADSSIFPPGFPPAQFITYTGTLGGSFVQNTLDYDSLASCGDGGTYYFPLEPYTTLCIGVNPPSIDDNPLFFMLQKTGSASNEDPAPAPTATSTGTDMMTIQTDTVVPSTTTTAREGTAPRQYTTQGEDPTATAASPKRSAAPRHGLAVRPADGTDAITNLLFSSMYWVCMRGAHRCDTVRIDPSVPDASPPWYMSAPQLRVAAPGLHSDDTGAYYSLSGDESSFASNGTVEWNRFSLEPPSNYTACTADGFTRYPPFAWNATTPFGYAVNFTNATASMELALTAPMGSVVLSFEGARVDSGNEGEGLPAIALADATQDEADGGPPHFTFVNGSDFHFEGIAAVANTSGKEMGQGSGAARTDWTIVGSMVLAVVFATLLL